MDLIDLNIVFDSQITVPCHYKLCEVMALHSFLSFTELSNVCPLTILPSSCFVIHLQNLVFFKVTQCFPLVCPVRVEFSRFNAQSFNFFSLNLFGQDGQRSALKNSKEHCFAWIYYLLLNLHGLNLFHSKIFLSKYYSNYLY